MLRKALILLSGNAAAALLGLMRNLLLARLIPVEDYGIASTFAVTVAVVEMSSTLGLHQQIVQAKEGDEPRFQAVLQGFQILRGLVSAMALFFLAGPIAVFLGIPHVTWAYQVLALVPVINALAHFDVHRVQRHGNFRPLILASTIPAAVSCAAIWPLVLLLGDWRAMLAAILLNAATGIITTHFLAERRYALALDPAVMRRALRYGLPILFDAVLLFLLFNGEKLIVGRELGMEALGIFAMGITLTLMPMLVIGRTLQNLFLPRLSQSRGPAGPEDGYQVLAATACEMGMIGALLFALGVLLLGEVLVQLLLGAKYADLGEIIVLLAVLQGTMLLKQAPATIALSAGQTENALAANVPRVILLPVAWWVAAQTGRLDLVVLIAMAGEAIGLGIAAWLMRRRAGISLRPVALQAVLTLGTLLGIVVTYRAGLWAEIGVLVLTAAALATMGFTRRWLLRRR